MLYVVEVNIIRDLAGELNKMRTWLDHRKLQTVGFRKVRDANVFRVDFESEQQAIAFAQAFAGQIMNRSAA